MKPLDVGIIERVYDEYELTVSHLFSLFSFIPKCKKLVFVNSICEEDPKTTDFLLKLETSDVKIPIKTIVLQKTWWTSTLWNVGLKHVSDCKFILMLDNDLFFRDNFLEPMLDAMREPRIAWVAPIYCDRAWKPDNFGYSIDKSYRYYRLKPFDYQRYIERNEVFPVLLASSSCSLFRYQALKEIGFFDERLPRELEQDVGLALWDRGWKVVIQPKSMVKHLGSYTKAKWKTLARTAELDWSGWQKVFRGYGRAFRKTFSILAEKYGSKIEEIFLLVEKERKMRDKHGV